MTTLFFSNPYALLPLACGFVIIIVGYIKLWQLCTSKHPAHIGIFGIWLMGIIGFLLGIIGFIISYQDVFTAIAEAGDISPALVADAMNDTYKPVLVGLAVLIISLIIWGILKGTKDKKVILPKA